MNFHQLLPVILSVAACALHANESVTVKTQDTGGASSKVKWTWANKGVAPCHPGGFPCLTLKDAEGGIVSVLTDETLDMRNLKVGQPDAAPVTTLESDFIIGLIAPTTKPVTYDLSISVGTRDGAPKNALPLTGDDGQRRYRLGTVTLQAP